MKIAKSDLATNRITGFFLFVYVFIFSMFPLMLASLWIVVSPAIPVEARLFVWTGIMFGLSFLVGFVVVCTRGSVLVGRDFGAIHWMRTAGKYLWYFFWPPFILVSVVLSLVRLELFKVEMWFEFIAWIAILEGLAVGIILDLYVRVFTSRVLARLYFGWASELKDDSRKVAAVREGFKQLRDDAAVLRLELRTSLFEQLLSTRLYEGKDIKGELADLIRHLSDGDSVVVALRRLDYGAADFLALAKTERKWQHYVESIARYLLPFVLLLFGAFVQNQFRFG